MTTMSLNDAYGLAHLAHYRLLVETSRPDRNLRLVVGHLMHYESLRTRIMAAEQHLERHRRASTPPPPQYNRRPVPQLQRKPSYAQLRTGPVSSSLLVPFNEHEEYGDIDDDFEDDDDDQIDYDDDEDDPDDEDWLDEEPAENNLTLARCPSASSQPPRSPPELETDDGMDFDDDDDDEQAAGMEPVTPTEPLDQELPSPPTSPSSAPAEMLACYISPIPACTRASSEGNRAVAATLVGPGWQLAAT